MNKDEILAKSRAENENQDLYQLEVQGKAQSLGNAVMILLAVAICAVKYLTQGRFDIGVFCLACGSLMASTWYEWVKMKKRTDLIFSIVYSVAFIVLLAGYFLLEIF